MTRFEDKNIESFLRSQRRNLEKRNAFGLSAVRMLQNGLRKEGASPAVMKKLVTDLAAQDRLVSLVCRRHPKLFHPNVAKAREENLVVYENFRKFLDHESRR